MQNRLSSRKRPDTHKGNTTPAQGGTQEKVPRMPHERDESSDSQAAQEPSSQRLGEQARQDVERGLVDTSKGEATEPAYDKLREGTPDPGKKFRP